VSKKAIIHFSICIVLVLSLIAVFLYRSHLVKSRNSEIEKNGSFASELASETGKFYIDKDYQSVLKAIRTMKNSPAIFYAIILDAEGTYAGGILNADTNALNILGAKETVEADLRSYIDKLTPGGHENFWNQIDAIKINFIERNSGRKAIVGRLKLGVLLPFGLIERAIIFKSARIWIIFLILLAGIFLNLYFDSKSKRKITDAEPGIEGMPAKGASVLVEASVEESAKTPPQQVAEELSAKNDGADLFSMEIEDKKDEDQDIVVPEKDIPSETGWIAIFNGWDLDDWEKNGNWYVSNNLIVGNPWKASIVRTDFAYSNYEFRFRARKISGADGFAAIFKCSEKYFTWVLGGWGNTRSEVLKIEETVTKDRIERGKWYEVQVSVLPEKVEGFLNGRRCWSLSRGDLEKCHDQDEFLNGIGVGLWNTLCKFKDIFLLHK
jgi:hypothetical protein